MKFIIKTNIFLAGSLGILVLLCGAGQNANAQTATIPTLEGTIGSPVNFAYTPDFFVVMDPTQTIGFGMQPYLTVGGTLLDVKCNGSGTIAVTENPGWDTLSLNPSSGTATMSFGLTAGLNVEFIAFGDTISGTLNIDQLPNNGDLGFYATNSFSSFLLNNPVSVSNTLTAPLLPPINTLDALSLWFGIVIPDWLANVNLDVNTDITLNQFVSGNNISTSTGDIGSEGQTIAVDISGSSYQLQNIQETWLDNANLSLGLGADLSAGLLWGALNVQLVNFGSVPLINWSTTYPLTSESTSVQFNFVSYNVTASSGSGGSISPNGTSSYSSGSSQQFTATPNIGYTVEEWEVDGSMVQNGGASYTLSNIQSGHTISVTFESVGSGATVLTGGASSIGTTTATLNGSVNPNGLATTAYFEWGTSTAYGNTTPNPPFNEGSGNTKTGTGAELGGLNSNTTYHYQLVAMNNARTNYGGDQTFTTEENGSAPTVLTGGATSIGNDSATLNGSVNPNGLPTTAYFEWGTSTAYGNTVPNLPFNSGSGNNKIGTSAELTGLSPNTLYHYQLVAVNSMGTTYGGDGTFVTTGQLPALTTGAASSITGTTAFLNGNVNPNGLPTIAYFEWGTNTAYGSTIPNPSFSTGNGNTAIGVSAELTGLSPNTTYHYQLLATDTVRPAYGGDEIFTTVGLPVPPVLGPVMVLPNGAAQITLTGSIGQSYIVLASADLVSWVTVTNLTLTTGTEQFVDLSAANVGCRFYRVVLP